LRAIPEITAAWIISTPSTLNISEKTVIAPPTPFDAALANAVYNMVERADELQADAVIFVRTKTKITDDKGKRTVSVHISGLAVKLK
jgi:hypothetical protein